MKPSDSTSMAAEAEADITTKGVATRSRVKTITSYLGSRKEPLRLRSRRSSKSRPSSTTLTRTRMIRRKRRLSSRRLPTLMRFSQTPKRGNSTISVERNVSRAKVAEEDTDMATLMTYLSSSLVEEDPLVAAEAVEARGCTLTLEAVDTEVASVMTCSEAITISSRENQ